MRERDIETWLRKQIVGLGGVFLKFTSPGRSGVPDRIAIFPDGRLVFVELKTETGKPTKVQAYVCKQLIDLKQTVCIVHGINGAKQFLEDMENHSRARWIYKGGDA